MHPRSDSQVRCAFCHAPAGTDARACDRCRTVVHADCLATNGGCPTLGCEPRALAGLEPRPLAAPAETCASPLRLVAVIAAALALAALSFQQFAWLVLAASALAAWAGASVAEWSLSRGRVTVSPLSAADLDESLPRFDGWLELEDPDHAGEVALAALAHAPREATSWLRLGLAHAGRGEAAEAERALTTVVERLGRPRTPADAHVAALSHAALGDGRSALRALDASPAHASRARALLAAVACGAAGDRAQARRALRAMRRLDDDRTSTWTLRARVARCAGDLPGALAAADEAVRACGPDDPWPFEVRGRLRLLAGLPGGALEDLGLAAARAWRGEAGPHLSRGVVRAITGDPEGARRDLRVALDRAPRWSLPRLWLAALGDDLDDDKALGGFDQALARCLRGAAPAAPLLEQVRKAPVGGAPEQDASGPRGADAESFDGRPIVPARPASGLRRTHHTDGPITRRRRRLVHGLLGVAAQVRGDDDLAASHAAAVRDLSDDGSHVCDWAVARRAT